MSIANLTDSGNVIHEPTAAWPFNRIDVAIAVVSVVSVIGFLGSREIDGVRERRLAGSTADIARHGHWSLPTLCGEPRFLKPPLSDWLAAASMKLFGWSEFSFRLPFALTGLGIVALGYVLGRQMLGPVGGRITALILATTYYFVGECHSACTDLPMTFFSSAALVSWWTWQRDERPWSRAWWCMYASLAFACLAKGPVALAVFAIPVALELWASGRWSLLRRMRLGCGVVVIATPLVAWVGSVCLQVDDAFGRWWADMQLSFNNRNQTHFAGFFSHLAQWPMFSFPWSVLGLAAFAVPLVRRSLPAWPALRFSYFWMAGVFAFFCTWAKQPMHYLLPVTLPLAVVEAALVARGLEVLRSASAWRPIVHAARVVCVSFLCFAGMTAGFAYWRASASPLCVAIIVAVLATPAIFALVRLESSPDQSLASLGLTGLMCVAVFSAWINPCISSEGSCAEFARRLEESVPASDSVYFNSMQESLAFYFDRTLIKVRMSGDANAEQTVAIIRPGFWLLGRSRYEQLAELLERRFQIEVLADDAHFVRGQSRSDFVLLGLRDREAALRDTDVRER